MPPGTGGGDVAVSDVPSVVAGPQGGCGCTTERSAACSSTCVRAGFCAAAADALLLLLLLLPVRVQPRLPSAVLPVQLLQDQLVQGWQPCSLCVCARLEPFSFVSVEVDVVAPPCHLLELIRLALLAHA